MENSLNDILKCTLIVKKTTIYVRFVERRRNMLIINSQSSGAAASLQFAPSFSESILMSIADRVARDGFLISKKEPFKNVLHFNVFVFKKVVFHGYFNPFKILQKR